MKQKSGFSQSYYGKLRALIGSRLMLVTGGRIIAEDEQGRYLFQKRNDWDVWGFPGGVSEIKESLQECALREFNEETGLTALNWEPIAFASGAETEISTYPNGDQVHCLCLIIHVVKWEGVLNSASSESLNLEFFYPNEVPGIIRKCDVRAIEALCEFKKSKKFQLY
ncbi:MAG: NUDIX domain-containing protein [Treponema sp.]|nr:NUDIX domain-containing protein [Treponema sp.]